MQNLMNDLTKLFKKDNRIFADGKLLKNKLAELALKLDQALIELLLSDKRAKETFFIEQTINKEKVLVFDKDKFISFVNNKEFLPDSFTSFKNKIGLMTNGDYLKEKNDVVLAWAYKDCVLEGGQDKEDQKRDEIFYNETLAPDEIDRLFEPKVLTNFKKYDVKGEHKVTDFTADDNLIIKGNNLPALHCLKKKFRGKVKLIYIDPPYNTGNDGFNYNDRFNHSSWLSFMKNRLEIARVLLTSNGVIFISCDDNEQAYLKVLCDEIFDRDNFITNFAVIRSEGGGLAKQVVKGHDYLLTYAKDINCFEPLRKPKDIRGKIVEKDGKNYWIEEDWLRKEFGKYGTCLYEKIEEIKGKEKKKEIDEGIKQGLYTLIKKKKEATIVGRYRLIEEDGTKFYSVLKHLNADGKNELTDLIGTDKFPYPKPISLLKEIIAGATFFSKDKGDIILDFFAGSGTTAHAVLDLNKQDEGNRKFILCEQMDYVDDVTVKRVHKVIKNTGGGSFIYAELMEWNEKYMQDIKDADTSRKLLNIYEKMKQEAFFRYDIELSKFDEKEFAQLPLKDQKQVLCECLDKNHLYVNLSEIDDATYKVSAEDKKLNKEFYRQSV